MNLLMLAFPHSSRRCFGSTAALLGSVILCAATVAEDAIDFSNQIRPIFAKHCTACHGGVKEAGDVSFVTPAAVLPPDGWLVEPGDPDGSLLIERIESGDPDAIMPPPGHGKGLSNAEKQLLRDWIQQGAQWSGHWAYESPLPQPIPDLGDTLWPIQALDHFVLARLQMEQIEPSPEAPPQRWLRRATLDLTGLPPTLQQRRSFLKDIEKNADSAYASAVDQMLKSPAFGERWASVWLDQIRYADSRGLGLDARRNIWKYRDWVVDAFNADMPYTDFTIKQIAGDLLTSPTIDDLVATAAHRLTQTNQEGGTDDEEFRVAAVLDRVRTTWQTWQGVTFGCVQCHSHPYDPFKHEEFYQFAAFFNNSRDCDLGSDWPNLKVPLNSVDYPRASELDRQILATKTNIWDRESAITSDRGVWIPVTEMTAQTNNDTQIKVATCGNHAEFQTVDTVSKETTIILEATPPAALKELTAIRFTGMPLVPETALSNSEWGFVLSHVAAQWVFPDDRLPLTIAIARVVGDEADPHHNPQDSLNRKTPNGFSAYSRVHYPRSAAFIFETRSTIPANAKLRITLKQQVSALGAFPLVSRRGHIALSDDERFTDILADSAIVAARTRLIELKKERKTIRSTSIPIMQQRPKALARPSHVFIRGAFLDKGERVTPGTPASLPPLPEAQPADRLALAKWLVSPQNPLTSRVAVNRIWARLFEYGLVATEEDFGTSGEAPSHPKLLDFLALRFQSEHGYRFKPLIREIVLSRTYRQSSVVRADLLDRDPDNRLLCRGPRQRLSAEIVRDQALACGGLLSQTMGGKPVYPPIPEGVWRPFVGDDWKTPEQGNGDRYRRSIYTYTKRSIPYPIFASFDSPSREFCSARRLRSNTPLQALTMLNDTTFVECAAGLAKRMLKHSDSSGEQLRHGFLIVTSREPSEAELEDLMQLHNSYAADDKQAAMSAVAGVLLNLDEVITK